jgi:cob(I)alamin adenosyltransferase
LRRQTLPDRQARSAAPHRARHDSTSVSTARLASSPASVPWLLRSRSAALAHVARTVARRAERSVVSLAQSESSEGALNDAPRHYLNRLSDLLFVLARVLNRANLDGLGGDDVYWRSRRLSEGA